MTNDIAIIILAAGASRRFGSPKQLARIGEQNLLERMCKTAVSTGMKTVVVLGANAKDVLNASDLEGAEVVINENWDLGMSSSIKAGLEKTLGIDPEIEAVLLVLCDQPFVTKETLQTLIEKHQETGKPIVASEYSETIGTPALFTKEVFDELLKLSGDKGAKALMGKYAQSGVAIIDAPEAAFDVDTEADLEKLSNSS